MTMFWDRMHQFFGENYADSVAKDFVIASLGDRTVNRALAEGEDAKIVWRAVCDTFNVPDYQRLSPFTSNVPMGLERGYGAGVTDQVIHFDSAACGRSSAATRRAVAEHADREAQIGAYVAQAEAGDVIEKGRAGLAGLLGMDHEGVAFTASAAASLEILLDVWPLEAGDSVALVRAEWGPNIDAFTHRGLDIVELGSDDTGVIDLDALRRLVTTRPPAFVHLTQVASHRPLLQPVAEAAVICRAAGVPLWVDAAQALGHVDTASAADASYATGRKWLTGPRGAGVLAIAERWWDRLTIPVSDLVAGMRPAGSSPVWFLMAGEASVVARIGLCAAVAEYLQSDPSSIWRRLAEVGRQTRETLADLPGWSVAGPVDAGSAITALRAANGQDVTATRARLLDAYGIVTTAGGVARAPREMAEPLLRISPHVDCTADDLAQLRKALLDLS
jgi:pyridoxal 5-phosphate dependent beta-lyase